MMKEAEYNERREKKSKGGYEIQEKQEIYMKEGLGKKYVRRGKKNSKGSRKNEEEGKNNERGGKNTKCLTYEMRTCKFGREYPCKEHKMEQRQ